MAKRTLQRRMVLLGMMTALLWPASAFAKSPERIVTIGPSITEMAVALGLEKRLVGVCSYCDTPLAIKRLPKVGGAQDLSEEAVMALKPDLILTVEGNQASFDRLARLTGAPLKVLPTRHISDIWRNIETIGRLTAENKKAAQLVASLKAGIAKLTRAPAHRKTVIYMVWNQPLMIASKDSYIGDLIRLAGGRDVEQTGGRGGSYPVYSLEALLAANPDVILGPQPMKSALAALAKRYPQLKAVKSGSVRTLNDNLISRPGTQVVQALGAVEAALR